MLLCESCTLGRCDNLLKVNALFLTHPLHHTAVIVLNLASSHRLIIPSGYMFEIIIVLSWWHGSELLLFLQTTFWQMVVRVANPALHGEGGEDSLA